MSDESEYPEWIASDARETVSLEAAGLTASGFVFGVVTGRPVFGNGVSLRS